MALKLGYKQTEVGLIPKEWDVRSIGQMFRLVNGCAFKPEEWRQHGVPIIRIQNLNDPSAPFNFCQSPVPEKNRVEPGDLLFAWSGTIGTSFGARLWAGPSGVLNQHIFKVLMDQQQITLPFALLVFARVEDAIAKQAHGFKASFVHVKKSDLVKVSLPLPPLPEQRAIAHALSDVNALLDSLDRLIAKKRDLKQAAMQQLLTGRLRLPGFAGARHTTTLGELARIKRGASPRPIDSPLWFDESSSIGWVRISDVTQAGMFLRETTQRLSALGVKHSRLVANNSLIMSICATVGRPIITAIDVCIHDGFVVFDDLQADKFYLYYVLKFLEPGWSKHGQTGSQMNLNTGLIKGTSLSLPSSKEQEAIAEVLMDMDAELAALEQRRDKTRLLKEGMMEELLTGRVRLMTEATNVVPFPTEEAPAAPTDKPHNWQINEAVVIAVLTERFGSEQFPLGRKRYTKLSYLFHRHVERTASGYLKKAAGPYNPATRYKGPEGIAQRNGYVRAHTNGQYEGFVAAEKIADAQGYFQKWYGDQALGWLDQFRYKKNDELELIATVDMAMEDLRSAGITPTLDAVKKVIHDHPEWEAKLSRPIFSDTNIAAAMKTGEAILGGNFT